MACGCGEKHCQSCVVLYGYTAVHFSGGICAWAGHTEDWSDWWARHSSRALERPREDSR